MVNFTTKWGNPLSANLTFSDDGTPINLDTAYDSIVFTVKDNLEPDNDSRAKIQKNVVFDPDQDANTGKATITITADENKLTPRVYQCDFKFFKDGVLVNSEIKTYEVVQVVGKDD